ncbi:MAG TPA: PEP-CTERM sorting domain-containing protein [Planctomycetota bacterium]|nr:PEP-CTERM sorting domain-containing protein [Planctomycetota bacterium]
MTSRALLVLSSVTLVAAARAGDPPSFTGVGDLAGGNVLSAAYGVSGDGSVVCGYSNSSTGDAAFRWTAAGGLQPLGDLPGGATLSYANAVSADGSAIVGHSLSGSGDEAFRWTASGMLGLGDLPGNGFFSIANGVNADGSVVVGHSESALSGTLSAEGFRWTAATGIQPLGDLPGSNFFSVASAVSADGLRIAGYGDSTASGPSSSEATRWSWPAAPVGLGDLPGGGFGGNAFGISADGNVIVGLSAASAGVFAFRWSDPAAGGSGMQSIGDIPGGSAFSRANGISADGSVIVGQSVGPSGMEAFVWTAATGCVSLKSLLTSLGVDLNGWTLEVAQAISADGRTIVGYGPNPSGNYEGWVAHLGDAWTDLGRGIAGVAGVPALTVHGALIEGHPLSVAISGAKPSGSATLVIGLSALNAPFKGGTMVPNPDALVAGLGLDGVGGIELTSAWPAGVPGGTSLWLQAWIADAAAVKGLAASNAEVGTVP